MFLNKLSLVLFRLISRDIVYEIVPNKLSTDRLFIFQKLDPYNVKMILFLLYKLNKFCS